MESKIYAKHTYNPVTLTHKKHVEDYKLKCGDCHHDSKGKPLNNLKPNDKVQLCSDCHKNPGKKPAGAKLSDKDLLQYHAEAVHKNCIDCHKDFKKKNPGKKAPVSCNDCHKGGKIK
jgi:nitrate/TMAO reductase-like tetraheme cytochrome c subunit